MNDYLLKKLAQSIAGDNSVKKQEAQKMLAKLSLKDLKKFLHFLKNELIKSRVEVASSDKLPQETQIALSKKFKGKHMVQKVDQNLGAGMLVKTYDMIFDLTVMGNVKQIAQKIEDAL